MNLFKRAKEDPYNFILGRNFLQDIKLDIKNSTRTFHWDEIEIPMIPRGHWNKTSIGNFWKLNIENKNREKVTNYSQDARANIILDANHTKPDIEKVANEQNHLILQEICLVLSALRANIQAFQGERGKWTGSPISFELNEGEKPFYAKPFRIPHSLQKNNEERSGEVS